MMRFIVDVYAAGDDVPDGPGEDYFRMKNVVRWQRMPPDATDPARQAELTAAAAAGWELGQVLLNHYRGAGERIIVTRVVPAPEPSSGGSRRRRRVRPWLLGRLWTGNRPRDQ